MHTIDEPWIPRFGTQYDCKGDRHDHEAFEQMEKQADEERVLADLDELFREWTDEM